jgi:membrane associated rhomboid family serine protease
MKSTSFTKSSTAEFVAVRHRERPPRGDTANRLPDRLCDNGCMATPATPVDAEVDPLEDILRRCAAAAPSPWYPRQFAKAAGISMAELEVDVEFLWMEGLLRPVSRPGDRVPGLTLTEAGARMLANPAELHALRNGGHAATAQDAAARRALREVGAPVVSRVLLVVNLFVFGAGVFLAMGRGAAGDYLAGITRRPAVVADVLHRIGSLSADDLVAGRWWRLMTAAFVHGSLLHLAMNMSMLAFGCGLAESMWGRSRYLVIYLIAAFGGNCVAMAWQPTLTVGGDSVPLVGASGALCGVFAAMLVWVLLNGRHLPRAAASQLRMGLIVSGVFLVFLSLFPQVSGLCHLGGALFGAAAALLLHFHRWGTATWRLVALAGLAGLPWLGLRAIDRQRATDPRWHGVEHRVFNQLYKQRNAEVTGEAAIFYGRRVAPLLNEPPRTRDERARNHVLADMVEKQAALHALMDDLAKAGPYNDTDTEHGRERAAKQALDLAEKFATAEEALRTNANTSEQDDIEERAFTRQFLTRIPRTMTQSTSLYRDEVRPLLETPPRERNRDTVDKVLRDVERLTRELADLTEALGEAGPYGNPHVDEARQAGERYAAARTALTEAAARCLRAADKWTADDQTALQKRADEVDARRGEWEKLVEPK